MEFVNSQSRFVAFVGAGASRIAPSYLPTWFEFNTLLLECLCNNLAVYSGNRQPTDQILSIFRNRRDQMGFFSPDFQAQLMEEEIGNEYFKVWQSLETDSYGPVHSGLAELALVGRVAAIVTTNFDKLIETAMAAKGVAVKVFHDRPEFESLRETIKNPSAPLPILKIHGSIEDVESLVDTLKQRVVGRPESLAEIMRFLLREYPWMYLGFSGADFSYNPNYLGILDAAMDAKGFVFLARDAGKVQEGVRRLADAYGSKKATIVQGDLSNWISDTFFNSRFTFSSNAAGNSESDVTNRVRNKIQQWTDGLGPMAVINIVSSLLKSSGMEAHAYWLLRRTWKSYRTSDDTQSKSYARYNYNHGMSLLDAGFLSNPIARDPDMANLFEWKEHADRNAFEFFARSFTEGTLLIAGAQLASVLAYRGEVGKAISLASDVTDTALAEKDQLAFCDITIACVVIYDIVQIFKPAVKQLRHSLETARKLGDEPRRGILCAHLGRFLTYAGNFKEAEEFIEEADRVGARLGLEQVILASRAARGLWLVESGSSASEAVGVLRQVVDAIHKLDNVPLFAKLNLAIPDGEVEEVYGRHPILCRTLLDLAQAAMTSGEMDVLNETLDELDVLVGETFLGYCPHYYLLHADCLFIQADQNQVSLAVELVQRARRLGELSQNPWVAKAADNLELRFQNET